MESAIDVTRATGSDFESVLVKDEGSRIEEASWGSMARPVGFGFLCFDDWHTYKPSAGHQRYGS